MAKKIAAYLVVLLVAGTSSQAVAQNARDVLNMFGVMMHAAIVNQAKNEWSKLPSDETSCINQALQRQGYSVEAFIQNGVVPNDTRLSAIRSNCGNSIASLPSLNENNGGFQGLSSKPTFDCSKAKSATARIVCLDQAGAKADWDLTSAYWARYSSIAEENQNPFDKAQQNWLDSLNTICRLDGRQIGFLRSQQQCVLDAYRKRAAGYRSQLNGDPLAESQLSPEEHARIQLSLISKGLLHDEADGEFGPNTRTAIKLLQAQSGLPIQSGFLTVQQTKQLLPETAQPTSSQGECIVMDPTGTPLNVRSSPNGDTTGTLGNGVQVYLVKTDRDARGHQWSLITQATEDQPLGWVYSDYIHCASGGAEPAMAVLSDSDLLDKAAHLSLNEAAIECESSDTETRLVGCTAIINAKTHGENSTVSLADALDGRCSAYNDLGQFQRGLADCRASIVTAPRYSYAYNNLGTSLLGLVDLPNAINAFTKCIELKPTFIYAYLGRAKAFAATGNAAMARKDFQYALSIDPTSQQATDGIAALDNPAGVEDTTGKPLQATSPPKETAKLREAHAFLADSKKFIADQKSVPSISSVANEAANLQIALDRADEAAAVRSVQSLDGLLKPMPGFEAFEQQQKASRDREDVRKLADVKTEAARNLFFVDTYMKDNLGDAKTTMLLKLRQQIEASLQKNTIEEINGANDALRSYVDGNGLSEPYQTLSGDFPNSNTTPSDNSKTIVERLGIGDKSRFLVEGAPEDIVLLYNSSQTAPSVWKNVRGDIVFQNNSASMCFAQASPDVGMARYIQHILGDQGAKHLSSSIGPCNLSNAPSTIDLIAFQRGELLKDHEDYIATLAKLVEDNAFLKMRVINDYASKFQKMQTFSLEIERDVENGQRKGFGVISVSEPSVACIITPDESGRIEGIKELLRRNTDVIAPKLSSDWQFIETNTDLAYLGLQRRQCGYVAGDSDALRTILLALHRDKIAYAFASVWWDAKDVDQAMFDVRDQTEQAIRKKVEIDRASREQEELEARRQKDMQSQKTVIENQLRQKNGVRARGLMNGITEFVKELADQRLTDINSVFPMYSNWLNSRFADHWETFNVNSDIADFGTVQWDHRPLDAVIVKSTIQQKNRILGKYEDHCFMFGLVDDPEFSMRRDPFVVDCNDGRAVERWEVGESFQSQWNAK